MLINIALQNISIRDTGRYEAQKKITNKIIRRENNLYEKKMIENLEINRCIPEILFNINGNIKKGSTYNYKLLSTIVTNKSGLQSLTKNK